MPAFASLGLLSGSQTGLWEEKPCPKAVWQWLPAHSRCRSMWQWLDLCPPGQGCWTWVQRVGLTKHVLLQSRHLMSLETLCGHQGGHGTFEAWFFLGHNYLSQTQLVCPHEPCGGVMSSDADVHPAGKFWRGASPVSSSCAAQGCV